MGCDARTRVGGPYDAGVHAETSLACEPSSVRAARQFITSRLRDWNMQETAFTAVLLASELVTNAVLHARTAVRLVLDSEDGSLLRVGVYDLSARPVRRRRHSPDAGTGRGLVLVEQLAREWGVDAAAPGKCVWFRVAADEPEEPVSEPDLEAFLVDEDADLR